MGTGHSREWGSLSSGQRLGQIPGLQGERYSLQNLSHGGAGDSSARRVLALHEGHSPGTT